MGFLLFSPSPIAMTAHSIAIGGLGIQSIGPAARLFSPQLICWDFLKKTGFGSAVLLMPKRDWEKR